MFAIDDDDFNAVDGDAESNGDDYGDGNSGDDDYCNGDNDDIK